MNIGRSEYTRLVRQEVKLKKAEKLLEECFSRIGDMLVNEDAEYGYGRDLNTILKDINEDCPLLLKNIQKFLEER